MTETERQKITEISQEFASGFKNTVGEIKGSGWLIADPLSAYLNAIGYKNEVVQIPANEQHPQILILKFPDGLQFIPAGSDLPFKNATDWFWL